MITDADAVVLDFGLSVDELGALYPGADLLASADIRMGLINTGVLVLRNTPWMRLFLHHWWYGPHSTPELESGGGSSEAAEASRQWRSVCDQDAFDRLYSLYAQVAGPPDPDSPYRISDKVKVLAMDAINSHPPRDQQPGAPSAPRGVEVCCHRSWVCKEMSCSVMRGSRIAESLSYHKLTHHL